MIRKLAACCLVLIITVSSCTPSKENEVAGQEQEESKPLPDVSKNPVIAGFNQKAHFNKIEANHIYEATEYIIGSTKTRIKEVASLSSEIASFPNTMIPIDDIYSDLAQVYNTISILKIGHAKDSTRIAAKKSIHQLDQFYIDLSLNEDLYNTILLYSSSPDAQKQVGYRSKFIKEQLEIFEQNGLGLSLEKREELKAIKLKIIDIENQFNENITSFEDTITLLEKDLDGLSSRFKIAHKVTDSTFFMDLKKDDYKEFMSKAKSETARKRLYFKYQNKAKEKNIPLLKELLAERHKMAKLLGYDNYAQLKLSRNMAKTVETAIEYEKSLAEKIFPKAKAEYEELLKLKKKEKREATAIYGWDIAYYSYKLINDTYKIDTKKLKENFELFNLKNGIAHLYRTIFDIDLRRDFSKPPSVWNKDVEIYEVHKAEKVIGLIYLDLYPRLNKTKETMCIPITEGRETEKGKQIPKVAIISNYPKATPGKAALLSIEEVERYFKLIGQALHHILSETELGSQSAYQVASDFLAAPSNLFANWVWNWETVVYISRHYQTGRVIDKDLYAKVQKSRNALSGLKASKEIFRGLLDLKLHSNYDPNGSQSTTSLTEEIFKDIFPYDFMENTHPETGFLDLGSNAANYYSDMWANAYSADLFSMFEKNGILHKSTALRYIDVIMKSGATKNEIDLLSEFLGRSPEMETFTNNIGL